LPLIYSIRSTNIVHTIESAKCLVAGQFQQEQAGVVSILTDKAENEILYPNYHRCKLLKQLIGHRWGDSPTLPDIAADLQSIQRALGVDPHKLSTTSSLEMTWWPERLTAYRFLLLRRTGGAEFTGIRGAAFPQTIRLFPQIINIENKIQGTTSKPDRKLFLYSVHDNTLMKCLMVLGVFDMKWQCPTLAK
ncbi:hypothetical protein cypCar_00044270, partial [Cyprinus carpio]